MYSFLNVIAFLYIVTVIYELIQGGLATYEMLHDKDDTEIKDANKILEMHPMKNVIRLIMAIATVFILIGAALVWPLMWYLNSKASEEN